jgi:hypothetical protein
LIRFCWQIQLSSVPMSILLILLKDVHRLHSSRIISLPTDFGMCYFKWFIIR